MGDTCPPQLVSVSVAIFLRKRVTRAHRSAIPVLTAHSVLKDSWEAWLANQGGDEEAGRADPCIDHDPIGLGCLF